jgi:iron(III) transport system substrate-binding protein
MRIAVLVRRAAIAVAALAVSAAIAQPATNDAIFRYDGADRDSRLVERAKQEGRVVVYTSLAPTESQPLAQAFEKQYGIKVELWRALSDKVVQRTLTEAQARRHAVDIIETNGPEMEMVAREKILAEFHSPHLGDLPKSAIPPHRQWMPDRMNYFVVAYNTQKVRKNELPKSLEGFLDPKWKGRIGIEATDAEWMATIVKHWGPARGNDFFARLAAMKPDVRKGHVLLAELVSAGEIPVGLTVYNANAESMKRKGAPIDWTPIEPVVGRPQGIGVARNAPHPNAALLFADFVLSPQGQALFESMGRVPASIRIKSALNDFPSVVVDPATVLEEADRWNREWDRLFLAR